MYRWFRVVFDMVENLTLPAIHTTLPHRTSASITPLLFPTELYVYSICLFNQPKKMAVMVQWSSIPDSLTQYSLYFCSLALYSKVSNVIQVSVWLFPFKAFMLNFAPPLKFHQ
jgi:hypothetical protein